MSFARQLGPNNTLLLHRCRSGPLKSASPAMRSPSYAAFRKTWAMAHAAAAGPGLVDVAAPQPRDDESPRRSAGFFSAPPRPAGARRLPVTPCEWTKAHAFLVPNGRAGTGESYAQLRPVFSFSNLSRCLSLRLCPVKKAQKLAARQTSDEGRRVSRRRPLLGGLCLWHPCRLACAYLTDLKMAFDCRVPSVLAEAETPRDRGSSLLQSRRRVYVRAWNKVRATTECLGPWKMAHTQQGRACIKEERARNTTPTRVTVGEARIVVRDAVTLLAFCWPFSVEYVRCGI